MADSSVQNHSTTPIAHFYQRILFDTCVYFCDCQTTVVCLPHKYIYRERDKERYGHPDFSFVCVSHCGATRLGWRRGCAGSSHMYKHIYMYTDIHILYINIYTISNTTNKTHCFFFTRAPAREGEAVVAITYIYIYTYMYTYPNTTNKTMLFLFASAPAGGRGRVGGRADSGARPTILVKRCRGSNPSAQ